MSKRVGDPGYAAGWCIHYRGITGPRGEEVTSCAKGVEYESFRATNFKSTLAQQPCFLDEKGRSKPGALPCEHLRRPTAAEIIAHDAWVGARLKLLGVVRNAIRPWRDAHKGQSASEVIECPACKGRLHLSIAAYNGHVHRRCETAGCVAWTE